MKGIINTCFLVDWADYKRRDLLKDVFDEVILLSEIEKEISDQKARKNIRNWLDEEFMKFIRPSQRDINDAVELTTNSYDFVNLLEEYQRETKRRYSTHFVQKLIKSYEG